MDHDEQIKISGTTAYAYFRQKLLDARYSEPKVEYSNKLIRYFTYKRPSKLTCTHVLYGSN